MFKLRTVLMMAIAVAALQALPSTANAQLPQSAVQQLTPQFQFGGRNYVCHDPWITIAYNDAFAGTREIQGAGEAGQCNKYLYNGGSWSSYAELYQTVKSFVAIQSAARLSFSKQALANGTWRITIDGGPGFVRHEIISHDGGTLITSDGAGLAVSTVVSQGGGNITVKQGSNILTNNGGTLVGSGGASYRTLSTSGDELRINLGRSVVILRKANR